MTLRAVVINPVGGSGPRERERERESKSGRNP